MILSYHGATRAARRKCDLWQGMGVGERETSSKWGRAARSRSPTSITSSEWETTSIGDVVLLRLAAKDLEHLGVEAARALLRFLQALLLDVVAALLIQFEYL